MLKQQEQVKWWTAWMPVVTLVLSLLGAYVTVQVRLSVMEERVRVAMEDTAARAKLQSEIVERMARIEEGLRWLQREAKP